MKIKEYPKILNKPSSFEQALYKEKDYRDNWIVVFCMTKGQTYKEAKFSILSYAAYKNMDVDKSIGHLCSEIQNDFTSFKRWFFTCILKK